MMTAMQCQIREEIMRCGDLFGLDIGSYLVDVAPARHSEQIRLAVAYGRRVIVRWVNFEDLLDGNNRWSIILNMVSDLEDPAALMSKRDIIRRRMQAIGMRKFKLAYGFYGRRMWRDAVSEWAT